MRLRVAGAGGERKAGLDLALALLGLDAAVPAAAVALGLPMALSWLLRFAYGSGGR